MTVVFQGLSDRQPCQMLIARLCRQSLFQFQIQDEGDKENTTRTYSGIL